MAAPVKKRIQREWSLLVALYMEGHTRNEYRDCCWVGTGQMRAGVGGRLVIYPFKQLCFNFCAYHINYFKKLGLKEQQKRMIQTIIALK